MIWAPSRTENDKSGSTCNGSVDTLNLAVRSTRSLCHIKGWSPSRYSLVRRTQHPVGPVVYFDSTTLLMRISHFGISFANNFKYFYSSKHVFMQEGIHHESNGKHCSLLQQCSPIKLQSLQFCVGWQLLFCICLICSVLLTSFSCLYTADTILRFHGEDIYPMSKYIIMCLNIKQFAESEKSIIKYFFEAQKINC